MAIRNCHIASLTPHSSLLDHGARLPAYRSPQLLEQLHGLKKELNETAGLVERLNEKVNTVVSKQHQWNEFRNNGYKNAQTAAAPEAVASEPNKTPSLKARVAG